MENLKKHLFPSSRSTGSTDTRSVFHIENKNAEHISQEIQECFESVEEFKNAAKNLDGAGTHLTACLTQVLKEGRYHGIGEDCGTAFRDIYGCERTAILSQQFHEMSRALLNEKAKIEDGSTEDACSDYTQMFCKVLLFFLRTQQTYHKFCTDRLSELVQKLHASKGIQNETVLTDKYFSMVMSGAEPVSETVNNNSPLPSPKSSPKLKKAEKSQGSPKTKKSSFLSLFDRKTSPEDGKSAFYVAVSSESDANVKNEQDSHKNSNLENRNHWINDDIKKEAPQGNLIDIEVKGQMRQDADPKFKLQGPSPSLRNTPCHTSAILQGQGHLQNAGQGHSLVDFMTHPDGFESDMAAGSQMVTYPKGLDPPTSAPNHSVDLWNLQVPFGLPPPTCPKAGMTQSSEPLATEEDLESVINLLSGVNSTSSPMQSIPENQVQGQVQLTVPQIYRMPSPASDSNIDEMKHQKYQMHRRSEGCLDLTGIRGNTWPNLHRASLPAVQPYPHRQLLDTRDNAMFMRRYSQDMHMQYRPSATIPQSQGHAMSGSHWAHPGSSGTWPGMQPPGGSDTMNSSWSGVQDSSDLSDDSSSGEQFYAVGRDLVPSIHTKDDSSDDECDKRLGSKDLQASGGFDPHDKCNLSTWPPKQQWSQSHLYLSSDQMEPPPDGQFPHRPVQMQWSDPMSTRSMWPAGPPPLGVPGQRTSQSMQGFGTLQ